MTPTLIVVVNEIGTEKMTYKPALMSYKSFRILENDNPTYPAPNIPDGEHRAYLQWQYNPESISGEWIDESEEDHELSVIYDIETRQIWKLTSEQQPEGETAKQAAQKFTEQDSIYEVWNKIDVQDAFVEGAEWQRKQIVEVLQFMCGYTDFPERQPNQGAYYWRTILRNKMKEIGIEIPPSDEPTT